MVVLTIFIFILLISLPFIKNNLNASLIRRLCAISFICASVLITNTLKIQEIGSGIGLYSGMFQLNLITNSISFFLLVISAIIILMWPNFWFATPLSNREAGGLNQVYRPENYNNVYPSNVNKSNKYCLIILFNILGALFLVCSSDLVSMYLSIELQSFGLYVLATLYKENLSATSAGLKYFLLGGLSSCIILLGSGLIYTYTGITNLELVYTLISIYSNTNYNEYEPFVSSIENLKGISIGVLLIFSGFLFKIAAAPFHN